jgi:hypothetical protein
LRRGCRRLLLGGLILRLRVGNSREAGERAGSGAAHNPLTNLHLIPLRFLAGRRSRNRRYWSFERPKLVTGKMLRKLIIRPNRGVRVVSKPNRPKNNSLSINI